MFTDDKVFVGDSEEKLQGVVNELANVCWRQKLIVNVGRSKTVRISGNYNEHETNISINSA